MKLFLVSALFICSLSHSAEIVRIEVGSDYSDYSAKDLKRRVWELEKAVYQLQQKVFAMEMNKPMGTGGDSWICKSEAMGETFSATGGSRAVAENGVIEKCKSSPKTGNGFHCSTPKCSN